MTDGELESIRQAAEAGVPPTPGTTIALIAEVRRCRRELERMAVAVAEATGRDPAEAARDPLAVYSWLQAMARAA